jgi:hypothetical protein
VPAARGAAKPDTYDTIPDLPAIPSNSLSMSNRSGGDHDVDFDDLAKRFEELKKRK